MIELSWAMIAASGGGALLGVLVTRCYLWVRAVRGRRVRRGDHVTLRLWAHDGHSLHHTASLDARVIYAGPTGLLVETPRGELIVHWPQVTPSGTHIDHSTFWESR